MKNTGFKSAKNSASTKQTKEKKVPYHRKPELMSVDEWQTVLRKQFAAEQNFEAENLGDNPVFSDFNVYNPKSDKTYKVAIRSQEPGLNFCSCPDFKINLLGTCKHIEWLLFKLKEKKSNVKLFQYGYRPYYSSISLKYGNEKRIYLKIGENNHDLIRKLAKDYFDDNLYLKPGSFEHFEKFFQKAIALDADFRFYQDAMDYVIEVREREKRNSIIDSKFPDGINSPALNNLLKTKLYPYQKEGILFAAKAGRCLIADDMGLGKTIQAIGATEVMANEFGITKVLIVCPTSLKYQWKSEIEKFTDRDVLVIEGNALKRREQYYSKEFYKIISYNTVKYDIKVINEFSPDLVILDEAQRIKNWKTQTAINVKAINTDNCIVLTGTPLENKLEELHSIVEFIDRYKLGALFRFLDKHQSTDENTGKVTGYKNLNSINDSLKSILIRRRKKEILTQLPERIDKNYFLPVTEEQMELHNEYDLMVKRLVNKWIRFKFLSEADRKRLLLGLSCMRMVADSTYILDQKTRYDTKIDELMILLKDIFEQDDEKVVIFSQWERMTRLVAEELDKLDIVYEYLHGGVPGNKRKDLLTNFHNNPESKVFLSTDAGGVGLNLQCASTVINLDIPWNPAVLEQRIARVHRMGQKKHVNVFNFISKNTIEEKILSLLGFKTSVFEGVLDNGEDQVFMGDSKFNQFMKTIETLTEEPQVSVTENNDNNINEINEKVSDISLPETEPVPAAESYDTEFVKDSSTKDNNNQLQEFFSVGINILQKLSNAMSDKETAKKTVSSFIKKDESTGKLSLNIPIPDEAVIDKALEAVNGFLKLFSK